MDEKGLCAGCSPSPASDSCIGSFARIGVLKIHWECWSDCNLSCSFCYRTKGRVLLEDEALRLIRVIWTSGTKRIVFAGGDPSLRTDINKLISFAKRLGLQVEVQTNSHLQREEFLKSLISVDLIGLSLDGGNETDHDSFRSKPGNFHRVLAMMEFLEKSGVPMIVRTVASKQNKDSITMIGDILKGRRNLQRWSIMEFSPIEGGYLNSGLHTMTRDDYDNVISKVKSAYSSEIEIDAYKLENKVETYALITPNGLLYGTGYSPVNGVYPVIGSVLCDHLSSLAQKLPFSPEKHLARYGDVLA